MTSLELFRALIPAMASIPDATVMVYLELAASRHDASTLGAAYASMMVWWAAHTLARTPGLGGLTAQEAGPLVSQRDGDLQRQYAGPSPMATDVQAEMQSTTYGRQYLAALASRAAVSPRFVGWGTA
ncbi:MAG: DUF4054 domain-containing protein [Myxococcota bacterium]